MSWAARERVRPTSPALVRMPVTGRPSSWAAIRPPKTITTTLYTLTSTLRRVLLVRTSSRAPASSRPVSSDAPYSPQLSSRMTATRYSLSRNGLAAAAAQGREARARYSPVSAANQAAGRAKLPTRMPTAWEGRGSRARWGNSHFCSQWRSSSPAASSSPAQAHRAPKAG